MKKPDEMNEDEMREWIEAHKDGQFSEEAIKDLAREYQKDPEGMKEKMLISAAVTMEVAKFHPKIVDLIGEMLTSDYNPVIFLKYMEHTAHAVVDKLREHDPVAVGAAEEFCGGAMATFVKVKVGDFMDQIIKSAEEEDAED